ncbi:MAG: lipoyl(octanoyl) transferase LipB [Methylococcaceae bacterium]|nr:MAG: lipoyl(octanoyl) transferase LipB [Methylococcaceae bacterium]
MPTLRHLGRREYADTWQAMREFTQTRGEQTPDEIWIVEHPPVFTLGVAGRPEHVLNAGQIPVVISDRGGQVTYHGPGQLVLYTLLDMRRLNIGVKALVHALQLATITVLAQYGITAGTQTDAPGVYVDAAKIAALGLRVRQGCCYHGLSLNVNMDLTPFQRIDPCGYPGLAVTQLADFGVSARYHDPAAPIVQALTDILGY